MDGIIIFLIFIFSAVIHEVMHGWVAYQLGDSTAKDLGRLTLNPVSHMDPVGSVLLPLLLFFTGAPFMVGWAKPVPYNPYNLSDQRYGNTKVAFAGPLSNVAIALIFALFIRFGLISSPTLFPIFVNIVFINIALAIFNLIPVPPLDGSKLLMDLFPQYARVMNQLSFFGILIAFFIAMQVIWPITTLIFRLFTGIPI